MAGPLANAHFTHQPFTEKWVNSMAEETYPSVCSSGFVESRTAQYWLTRQI